MKQFDSMFSVLYSSFALVMKNIRKEFLKNVVFVSATLIIAHGLLACDEKVNPDPDPDPVEETDSTEKIFRFTFPDIPLDLNFDADNLTNAEEKQYGTNPRHHDSDRDKVNDDEEIALGLDPLYRIDSDKDGMFDDFEMQIVLFDANDQYKTVEDVKPDDDFDRDGRINRKEYEWGTNPAFAEPNILFIYPEDMGYFTSERAIAEPNAMIEGIRTPHIDQLASAGINFTRAFCGQSVCSPSKGAIYSGLAPHANWIWRNNHNAHPQHGNPDQWIPLPNPITTENDPTFLAAGGMHEDLPNMIQMFKANGIFCALTGKLHVQPARNYPYDIFVGRQDLETTINESNGRPWFFWANPWDTHAPFWQTVKNKLENPNNPNSAPKDVDPNEIKMLPWLPDTPEGRIDIAQYYSNCHNIDDFVGSILQKYTALGLEENTIIVFSPDHGIPIQRGKTSIYPAGTHVQCIVKGPGVIGNRKLDMPVSQMDLNPTFLEAYGIRPQKVCHGSSLWPVLKGENDRLNDRNTILAETNTNSSSAPKETGETVARAVCDGRFYYILNVLQDTWTGAEEDALYVGSGSGEYGDPAGLYYIDLHDATVRMKDEYPMQYELLRQWCLNDAPPEELYDLDADPWAVNNLADDPNFESDLNRMRNEMTQWRTKTNDKDEHPSAWGRRVLK